MEKKYWVPALEKANDVLERIAQAPSSLRQSDLSKSLGIHKSSMFSLLATMEALDWVVKEMDGTYSLGSRLGSLGTAFFKQFSLIERFHKEAAVSKQTIQETIQLAKLEQGHVLYLAKEEMPSPVRLSTEPGHKLPAYATALGKVMLAWLEEEAFESAIPEEELEPSLTPYTVRTRTELKKQLEDVRRQGYAYDEEESVVGFCCVAAPVRDLNGKVVAAISCSMFRHHWTDELKREKAGREMMQLAKRLSDG